ncbi:ABC transporter permease [Streptomyces sp. NPDC048172]|uniref:ABC transporter permease n=1 Tax=Streptomyces sp. NPDC048172 TaxID=3365505 RepID=UPI003715B3A9
MSPDPTPTAPPTAPAPAQRGQDVIHNIGYREYEGARLGRAYARRSLFSQSLRGAYGLGRSAKSKVLPMILFAVICMPAAIIVAVAVATKADELPVGYSEYVLMLQPVIGIFIAAVAPQMVSLDLRFKITPLYFSRPIERGDYVAAKYAALSAALFVFTAFPVVIMYVGALLAKLDFGESTKGFLQGLVFCAVFALLHAAIGACMAALTPRRGFGIAAIIVVLTIPFFLISALQGIAMEQDADSAIGWLGLASPGSLMDGLQSKFLGGISQFPGGETLTDAQGPLYLVVIAALTAGAYALLLRRYRKAGL